MKYLGLPLGAPFKEKLNWDPILECAEVGWMEKISSVLQTTYLIRSNFLCSWIILGIHFILSSNKDWIR